MLLSDVMTWLRGSCRFEAAGAFPERFLNLCARAEMGLWDIKRTENGLSARVIASKYRKLRPLARKCRLRLRILQKDGLPAKLLPYRKRAGMPLGFALFWGVIWLLSLFIWYVDIPTVAPDVQPKLEKALMQSGVQAGVLRSRLDGDMISTELELAVPELSWAGVSIYGSHATVDVREMEKIEKQEDTSQPCNVTAKKGGMIISVEAKDGMTQVSAGQTVAPGDLLISGVVELQSGYTYMTHAAGKVWARTDYELRSEISLTQTQSRRTGRRITMRRLMVLGAEMPLYFGSSPKGDFEREVTLWKPEVKGTTLPISVRTERWYETQPIAYEIGLEEAERLAREDIEKQISSLGDVEELSRREKISYYSDGVCMTVSFSAKEDIARQELILFE